LGTEGSPDELECAKRQLEQTTLPQAGAQQTDVPNEGGGGSGSGQPVSTDTQPPSQEDTVTPQEAPLGTEGSPDELECAKRQLEQTTLPPAGPQQEDPSP
jgi:hypothetical protein